MISRDLVLTINDKSVSLDKTITLYRFDRGITLNITLKSDTYSIAKEETKEDGEIVVVGEITKARAIILRPNKKLSSTEISDIVDGVYKLYLDDTWTDHLGEVGTYQIQLQLYTDNPDDHCITIAPFSFEVKNPIGIPNDMAAYVNHATVNNYSVRDNNNVPVGDLVNGEYLKTSWIDGDLITAGKLNKIETAIDYLVLESTTYADSADIPTNVSQLNNDAGYATESYINDAIEGVDLSNYATKDDIGDINIILDNINGEVI